MHVVLAMSLNHISMSLVLEAHCHEQKNRQLRDNKALATSYNHGG